MGGISAVMTLSEFLQRIYKYSNYSNGGEFTNELFLRAGNENYKIADTGSTSTAEKIFNGTKQLSNTKTKGRRGFPFPIKAIGIKSFFHSTITKKNLDKLMEEFKVFDSDKDNEKHKEMFFNALCVQLQNFMIETDSDIENLVKKAFSEQKRESDVSFQKLYESLGELLVGMPKLPPWEITYAPESTE